MPAQRFGIRFTTVLSNRFKAACCALVAGGRGPAWGLALGVKGLDGVWDGVWGFWDIRVSTAFAGWRKARASCLFVVCFGGGCLGRRRLGAIALRRLIGISLVVFGDQVAAMLAAGRGNRSLWGLVIDRHVTPFRFGFCRTGCFPAEFSYS